MATADLTEELNCTVCMNIYTDPVTLNCGHSFCLDCIKKTWDHQDYGDSTCPECRQRFKKKPELNRNQRLYNIVERLLSIDPVEEKTGIFCTYCIYFPVSAVKTCLLCEASLCVNHVRVHKKSEEHVLNELQVPWESRKCHVHKELLKYYCYEDTVCVCVSCSLDREHRGHQVELLNEASQKKKGKLRNILKKLNSVREETEKRVQSLQEQKRKKEEKAAAVTERVTALFRDIREHLEVKENSILSEITRNNEQVLLEISNLIQQVEKERDELSRKMSHFEELCNMTDQLTFLQEQESQIAEFGDVENGNNVDTLRDDKKVPAGSDVDEGLITVILYRALADLITYIVSLVNDIKSKRGFFLEEASGILLDVNIAHNYVAVSRDMKTASWADIILQRKETPQRFKDQYQVLSNGSFSSGQHYWEVETRESRDWRVGMCYPSIERRGGQSVIGKNNKSWCLHGFIKRLSVVHDSVENKLVHEPSCQKFGIFLDYETGHLSFYQLCEPIRHLYTFSATFTEPLHVAFSVGLRAWVKIRS
ncbi:E3 ubiquitin/ISG15 ligase TRIM25-like [Discoglossus pictus]